MAIIRVAGIDPALSNFGIARMMLDLDSMELSLESIATITTEPSPGGKKKVVRQNSDDMRRARELHEGFTTGIKDCRVVFGEIPSGTQMQRAAMGFGIAIGVMASSKIPLIEVMPLETRMASVGVKTAGKPEIISWAAGRYPEAPWLKYSRDVAHATKPRKKGDLHLDNEHQADAIAIVHAGIRTPEFKQLMSLLRAL